LNFNFGRYVCNEYNQRHPNYSDQLYHMRLFIVTAEIIPWEWEMKNPMSQELMFFECYSKEPLVTSSFSNSTIAAAAAVVNATHR
jgi:hypothetical protein